MNPAVLDYLKTQHIGVLAVEMMDGSPHGATVHFAHSEDPFVFYFETNRQYRKAEALHGRPQSRASFVIGVDESQPKTLQMDGVVRLLTDAEKEAFATIYFTKFPKKEEKSADPSFVAFVFEPTWWRFTDYTLPEGKLIVTSQ